MFGIILPVGMITVANVFAIDLGGGWKEAIESQNGFMYRGKTETVNGQRMRL